MSKRSLLYAAIGLAVFAVAVLVPSAAPKPKPKSDGGADAFAGAKKHVYREVNGTSLELYVFAPEGHRAADRRPAVVFFFGGGWLRGSPEQFEPQCKHFAARGMVAITADYRVYGRQKSSVADAVADAQAAMRWVRANAAKLGIDPQRIAAGGGSAGGHLAAATATLRDFTGEEKAAVGFRPDALVLFNPALDLTGILDTRAQSLDPTRLASRLGGDAAELSPARHVRAGLPPTIIFHGKDDALVPYAQVEAFVRAMKDAGNRCELVGYEGQGHGFFNPARSDGRYFAETMREADRFFTSIGWIERPAAGAATQAASRPAK